MPLRTEDDPPDHSRAQDRATADRLPRVAPTQRPEEELPPLSRRHDHFDTLERERPRQSER